MTQTLFNTFLAALAGIPVIALAGMRWKGIRRMLPALLIAALLAGGTAAAISLWWGARPVVDLSLLAPFPFVLTLDRLSAYFLLLICAVGAPVALFSSAYVERHYPGRRGACVWILLPLFIGSMALVVTASTAFAFLLGWELMTLFSAGLVLIDGDSGERQHNIFIYLLMMHAGAAAVVGAFLVFLPHSAGLDFAAMRAAVQFMPGGMRTAIFLLAFVGFGTKAGIIPLHLWLPRTHPIAPSPVSALMSAVMLKTAIYGLVRFGFDFLGGGPAWWGYLTLIAGAVSGVLGMLYAVSEHDLKRLLAYSSIENIGIIYLGLGTALVFLAHHAPQWTALALAAALLHALNHALFKSALFLGAGAIADTIHSLDIEHMGGLLKRMPSTGMAFLIACSAIIGLPLGNGFVSEWLTFRSFLAGAGLAAMTPSIILPLMTGVLALIGGLALACFAKVYGVAFLGRPRSAEAERAAEVPLRMQLGLWLPSGACIVLGIVPGIMLRPIAAAIREFLPGGTIPPGAMSLTRTLPWVAVAMLAGIIPAWLMRRSRRVTDTWACGMPALDSRMQYTATAISKPLRKVFARVYQPERNMEVVPADQPYFPAAMSYSSVRTTSFERSLYRPAVDAIVAAAHRLRQLQTGNIQYYLLYMFVALVTLLVLMRFA